MGGPARGILGGGAAVSFLRYYRGLINAVLIMFSVCARTRHFALGNSSPTWLNLFEDTFFTDHMKRNFP